MTKPGDGQVDMFDLLDDGPPVPPFTVHTCVWAMSHLCGWCGHKALHGGGGVSNPNNANESWFFSYCQKCCDKYGSPKLWKSDMKVNVDRIQKPRPGDDPNLKKGTP